VIFDKTTLINCCIAGLLTIAASSVSRATQYPVHQPVPGGIAVIALQTGRGDDPRARFGRTPILVLNRNGEWLGIVGIDLDTALGNYLITVKTAEEDFSLGFSVTPFSYTFERSAVKPGFPPDRSTTVPWRPELEASFPLMSPVKASRVSQFGMRYANDEDVQPVRWVTLSGIDSVEVFAPGRGVVVDVVDIDETNFYLTIDHGMGLQSQVGPLTQLRTAVDESVKRGETLGELGAETPGAASLNWAVLLNGVAVNPKLVADQLVDTLASD
jgi:murein DD-endopeptidase MepM/ murein hydrolase activator NlpD